MQKRGVKIRVKRFQSESPSFKAEKAQKASGGKIRIVLRPKTRRDQKGNP